MIPSRTEGRCGSGLYGPAQVMQEGRAEAANSTGLPVSCAAESFYEIAGSRLGLGLRYRLQLPWHSHGRTVSTCEVDELSPLSSVTVRVTR